MLTLAPALPHASSMACCHGNHNPYSCRQATALLRMASTLCQRCSRVRAVAALAVVKHRLACPVSQPSFALTAQHGQGSP